MNLFKTTLFLACATCCLQPTEAKTLNVEVKTPGTLEQLVNTDNLTELKISGTLNNADVRFLRHICGNDSNFRNVPSTLKHLDISGVDFFADNSYYAKGDKPHHLTGKHTLSKYMFYGCTVDEITLPEKLDSISYGALSFAYMKSLKIKDGVFVHNNAIACDSLLTELRVPAMGQGVAPAPSGMIKLRSVTYGDMDYMMSGAFNNLEDIEEIIFDGMVGHIDGYTVTNCPKLKRIIFRGPINTTGGPQFVKDCPELEEVRFDGLAVGLWFTEPINCPKLKGYTINGAVIESGDTTLIPTTSTEDLLKRPEMLEQLRKIVDWQIDIFNRPLGGFLCKTAYSSSQTTMNLIKAAGYSDLVAEFEKALEVVKQSDELRSKLEILKNSPTYKTDSIDFSFTYTQPSDSMLTVSREFYNLDSIAGSGDDISRIKNLLYWVHDLVRHDGGSAWPDCPMNLRELHKVCREEDRGVNCRLMAFMLTEALLAEGIPARYVTCESKAWATDYDCHVICVAWSESLNKWVWVDPTFAAYVTDENGLMLHPGEVRYRLQHDLPLILNEDANWNHQAKQTKEQYLDEYMAKNLYIMSCNTLQQAEPEGSSIHKQGEHVALVPVGSDYTRANIFTTDEAKFWQSPK